MRVHVDATTPAGTHTLKEEDLPLIERVWTRDSPHARVSLTVGRSVPYGELKVSATVSFECDQHASIVEEVAMHAFEKASEFATQGFEMLLKEDADKMAGRG